MTFIASYWFIWAGLCIAFTALAEKKRKQAKNIWNKLFDRGTTTTEIDDLSKSISSKVKWFVALFILALMFGFIGCLSILLNLTD